MFALDLLKQDGVSVLEASSLSQFQELRTRSEPQRRADVAREEAISSAADGRAFDFPGYCVVCAAERSFVVDDQFSWIDERGELQLNWRERQACRECGMNSRQRLICHLLSSAVDPSSSLYAAEQVTPIFAWANRHFRSVIGSEYLGDDLEPGAVVDGVRHEDACRLSFSDSMFEACVSLDCLEHIPDYSAALEELRRVLKPNGQLVLTAPFLADRESHLVRAKFVEEELVHLEPPEYHGDPLRDAGCLAYYHFGWQLLDELREIGFREVRALKLWSERFAYMGDHHFVFVGRA